MNKYHRGYSEFLARKCGGAAFLWLPSFVLPFERNLKMKAEQTDFFINQLHYCIRSANDEDAKELSEVRVQIDGETENMAREQGEGYIDEQGFKRIIAEDLQAEKNLFLVTETNGKII